MSPMKERKLTVRVSEQMAKEAERAATRRGESLSVWIRDAIRNAIITEDATRRLRG